MNRPKNQLPSRGRARRLGGGTNNRPVPSTAASWSRGDEKKANEKKLSSAQERFNQATQKHFQNAQEVLKQETQYEYESSSEEEELDNEIIVSKLTEVYQDFGSDAGCGDLLKTTAQYLTDCCQSGALTCLVCISSVKRSESVWNCEKCYACFHLDCIRKWILEGIAKATLLSDEYFPNRDQPWHCPKCRHEYSKEQCPTEYFCFCGKIRDPEHDMWTLPHSCGGHCEKLLQNPKCGHKCVLLCHPGPCPPCPQTIKLRCHCGKSEPTMKRCGVGKWSCGKKCERYLTCGIHKCESVCHKGDCKPCKHTSMKTCQCRREKRIQPCIEPNWQCEKICGKAISCGHHFCEKKCHPPGECGKCPHDSHIRSCPCGKQEYTNLRCVDEAPTCNDTCEKSLDCFGDHKCSRRCHTGPCGNCSAVATNKPCRCGKRERTVACHKEYICDIKCQKIRSCGNHPCKRKCCDGNCSTCEQICNKHLQCRKHKCQMTCHQGPCYPCPLTTTISCPCNSTTLTVVCGMERTTKPPRCRKRCMIESNCHHPERIRHTCHNGDCPPCKQVCALQLTCGHSCPDLCHDNVRSKKALRPWEPITNLIEKRPCPPCVVPVGVACLGRHDIFTFACHEAREHSCGRICGRHLSCTNHVCELQCHIIQHAPDDIHAGKTCAPCESECLVPRPSGCIHDCIKPCHPGDCPPCKKRIRKRCFCSATQLKFLCHEWTSASEEEKVEMQSCPGQCPKKLETCGHPCPLTCHADDCPTSLECNKKIVIRCKCRHLKQEFLCRDLQENSQIINCDDSCKKLKKLRAAELRAVEERKQERATSEGKTSEDKTTTAAATNNNKKSRYYKGKPKATAEDANIPTSPQQTQLESSTPFIVTAIGVFAAIAAMLFAYYNQL